MEIILSPTGMAVVAFFAWGLLGRVFGLVAGWLTLHGVSDLEDPRQSRPIRWERRGFAVGAIFFALPFSAATQTSPQYFTLLLAVLLTVLGGALGAETFMRWRRGSGDRLTHSVHGTAVGAAASIALQVFAQHPAAFLTVLGFTAWGLPLAWLWLSFLGRTSSPAAPQAETTGSDPQGETTGSDPQGETTGSESQAETPGSEGLSFLGSRKRPYKGSNAETTGFVTAGATALGLALVLAKDWQAPWLGLTLPAAILAWIVVWLAVRSVVGLVAVRRAAPARPLKGKWYGRENKDGPVILLLGGYMSTIRAWKPVIDRLVAGGCIVYAACAPWAADGDRPGLFHSVLRSARLAVDATLDELDRLYHDNMKFYLGHSFAGGLGLVMAKDPHPSLAGIQLIEPVGLEMGGNFRLLATMPLRLARLVPGVDRLLQSVIPQLVREESYAWFMEEIREPSKAALALRAGPRMLWELLLALPPETVKAGLVSALFGRGDTVVAGESDQRLSFLAETTEVPGGHNPHVTNSEAVATWELEEVRLRGGLPSATGSVSN